MNRCHFLAIAVLLVFSACGKNNTQSKSEAKVIGGTIVSQRDILSQHVGALVDSHGRLRCSVVAVTRSSFVTAAHCIHNRKLSGWTVQFGTTMGFLETLDVAQSATHDNFAPNYLHSLSPAAAPSDIAIIKTQAPSLSAIPVPIFRANAYRQLPPAFPIVVAGFGRTNGEDTDSVGKLQKIQVQVSKVDASVKEFTSLSSQGQMGCHGDSGAPALIRSGHRYVLVGVVSRGDANCAKGKTVYSDVTKLSQFIFDQIGKSKTSMVSTF